MIDNANLPNFICVGAPKCGTTALYADLLEHPEIFLPELKETHFFRLAFDGLPWNGPGTAPSIRINSPERYKALFRGVAGETAIGEVCPSYFAGEHTAEHIHQFLGPIKILIMLRNPAERAFSQFIHARLIGCEPEPSFLKAVSLEPERAAKKWGEFWSYLGQSHYAPVLKRYFTIFGRENVLVARHEHYTQDREVTLRTIYKFLDVDPDFAHRQLEPKRQVNISGVPNSKVSALAFKNIEKLAGLARVIVPAPVRRTVRSKLDRSLVRATLREDERLFIVGQLLDDLSKVETLTGWNVEDWKGRPV